MLFYPYLLLEASASLPVLLTFKLVDFTVASYISAKYVTEPDTYSQEEEGELLEIHCLGLSMQKTCSPILAGCHESFISLLRYLYWYTLMPLVVFRVYQLRFNFTICQKEQKKTVASFRQIL